MQNNDILRRLRFAFSLNDTKMMETFAIGTLEVSRETLSNWLKKDEDPDFVGLYDIELAAFLNGFIIKNRGKKDDETPKPEKSLNNNLILRKLKIALNLKDDDILSILLLADFKFSRHELSALFRNPNQDQYRVCKDQILRNFLMGLQLKYRTNNDNQASANSTKN
ncbi:MAG: DUF1456 family protein [Bacteroidia bacterium]|nr:DUF1456 family protein [Bacteroidia bacterium]